MSNYNAKDMFQLQSELVEVKVDMAVSKAIDRVIERIDVLRDDIHRDIHHIDKRLATTETSLNDIKKITDQVRTRLLDYGIKAIWIMIGGACVYAASLVLHYFNFIK